MENLNTPVLFLVFNRPDETQQVFETIRKVKPKQLFVAADGPRTYMADEDKFCARVRQIATNVDWDCEVKTLFRENNLGCGKAVSDAITWFFENVIQGIIVEDDCICDESFFEFAAQLLDKYKSDERIMHISANGPLTAINDRTDFSFVQYPLIWGWATWKRAWEHYDFHLSDWPLSGKKILNANFKNKAKIDSWETTFNRIHKKEIDTWDYQWLYACLKQKSFSIFPHKNLVSNIGFGLQATHTKVNEHSRSKMPLDRVKFPIRFPSEIALNRSANNLMEREIFELNLKKTYSLSTFLRNIYKKMIRESQLF